MNKCDLDRSMCVAVLTTVVVSSGPVVAGEPSLQEGPWQAQLVCRGGELPFGLELAREGTEWKAWLINGPQRIEVPRVDLAGDNLFLRIDHYDSFIWASVDADGDGLFGEWVKRPGTDTLVEMMFQATAGRAQRSTVAFDARAAERLNGRWKVQFSESDAPAVGLFKLQKDGTVVGTFMTTGGDYGYLAGTFEGSRLRLSCFDGSHAFLFDARMSDEGTLSGDFWSGTKWHETWTARRDREAKLPDGFGMTKATARAKFDELFFPNLDGQRRSLAEIASGAKVVIIEVFGTWCPNCHDAARYLAELDRRYRDRGVCIVGLAFELTGEFEKDARQVRRFAERHAIESPLFIGGQRGRDKITEVLPVIDQLRAYPTTIVLDAEGNVQAVHTGFSGPATGEEYQHLRSEFERLIERMLGERGADSR